MQQYLVSAGLRVQVHASCVQPNMYEHFVCAWFQVFSGSVFPLFTFGFSTVCELKNCMGRTRIASDRLWCLECGCPSEDGKSRNPSCEICGNFNTLLLEPFDAASSTWP